MKHVAMALVVFSLLAGCTESVDPPCFKEQISEFEDVDAFVHWLEAQPGITKVSVNKKLLATSNPPQVMISFLLDGSRQTLPLLVEPDSKLQLASP
jgi:hypothetical protein